MSGSATRPGGDRQSIVIDGPRLAVRSASLDRQLDHGSGVVLKLAFREVKTPIPVKARQTPGPDSADSTKADFIGRFVFRGSPKGSGRASDEIFGDS